MSKTLEKAGKTMRLDALALLQAEKACRDVIVAAADAVDQQNYLALVDLFTDDASLVRPGGGLPSMGVPRSSLLIKARMPTG